MLELLCDNCMERALPMVRWGGNGQDFLLSQILNSFNYQQFLILPSHVETSVWTESEDYREYCDRGRWNEEGGYSYEGLLTQCVSCVRQFAATAVPMMNAIIQPSIGDEIE
jgi:hypothetical protein